MCHPRGSSTLGRVGLSRCSASEAPVQGKGHVPKAGG